jgi:hypothetical protein
MTSVEVFNMPPHAQVTSDDFLLIIPPAALKLTCPVSSGQVNVPYSSSLMVQGGVPPYMFSILSGSLPPGLMLNANGTVTGTPQTAGTFSFVGQVIDSQGSKATTPSTNGCVITITPPPPSPLTLACPASTGQVGFPYNSALVATGGAPPYMFSIIAGMLPNGLALNPMTGAITGTPTSEGAFMITAKVVDSSGNPATNSQTQQCTITIKPCGTSLMTIQYNVNENNTVGEIAWFNSHLTQLSGTIPTSTFQLFITGGKIVFGPNTLSVPDAVITFSSTATCASTSFNTSFNRWETTVPLAYASKADEIFAAGLAYLIPPGFPQNVNNVTWSADISSSAAGIQVSWQYGVSNWLTSHNGTTFPGVSGSSFTPNYNGMEVDPAHNAPLCNTSYTSGDHAGSPEFPGRGNVLTGGGSGGGGSNWTGSWSSTPTKTMICQPTGPGPLTVSCPAAAGTVNTPYSSALVASGGTMPYMFSLASGMLTDGLMLNQTTGVISGTPTMATTMTFVGKVTDSSSPPMTATTPGSACTISIGKTAPCFVSTINGVGLTFAAIGLQGSNFQLSSGPLNVTGNLGIGANGQFHLSGGATVHGTLYADPTAKVQIDGGSSMSGGIVIQSMAAIQSAAINLSSSAAALTPTQTFSQIVSAMTISGNGGQNVISVPGTFHLSGGNNLTILGGPSDTFIFNVPNGLQLDGGSSIVLAGVSPAQVLFNFPGPNGQVQTSGNADTAGIFLAPQKQMQINGGMHNSEFISGGQLSFQSNPVVKAPGCP